MNSCSSILNSSRSRHALADDAVQITSYLNTSWLTLSKGAMKSICTIVAPLPTLQCTLQCMGHAQNCTTGTQTFPIRKLTGWLDHCVP